MTRGTGWFCRPNALALEALCCGRVLLGREEKVEGRAGRIHRTIQVAPLALDPDVGLVHPPTVSGRFESRAKTSFQFRGVTLHPSLQTVTWSTKSPRSARRSSTSRYDSEKRKYQPTASRMTSGSNCRHLNRPETEGMSRSIEPAYQITPPKLQHFLERRIKIFFITHLFEFCACLL